MQDNLYFKKFFWYDMFVWMKDLHPIAFVILVFLTCIWIYILVVPVEIIRKYIVRRLKIEVRVKRLNEIFDKYINIDIDD